MHFDPTAINLIHPTGEPSDIAKQREMLYNERKQGRVRPRKVHTRGSDADLLIARSVAAASRFARFS